MEKSHKKRANNPSMVQQFLQINLRWTGHVGQMDKKKKKKKIVSLQLLFLVALAYSNLEIKLKDRPTWQGFLQYVPSEQS